MILLALLACAATPDGSDCALSGPHLVLATTDYEAGLLAAVDPATGCVADALATLGPDPLVRAEGGLVYGIDRSGLEALRAWEPGAYGEPVAELAVDREANVQDVARLGGRLLLTQYELDELAVLDAGDGSPVATVDLGDHADADGLPEADQIVLRDGVPHVALQRLDRSAGWRGDDGEIVALDPDTLEVETVWAVGPNPRLAPHPDGARLVVLTGHWFEPDGALHLLDPVAGPGEALLTEAELGYDLERAAGVGEHVVLLGHDFEPAGPAYLDCWSEGGEVVRGMEIAGGWLVDATSDGERVWVASRPGWTTGGGDRAEATVYAVEPSTCAVEAVATGFRLPPFSIAATGGGASR